MRGVNKAIIVANLGKDPEIRYTANGTAAATFPVATSEQWTDKDGKKVEQTDWHQIRMYGKLAEIAAEYLKKGSKVYLEGSIHTDKWQDKQTGQDRYSTYIKAHTMQMLDAKPAGNNAGGNRTNNHDDFDDDIGF